LRPRIVGRVWDDVAPRAPGDGAREGVGDRDGDIGRVGDRNSVGYEDRSGLRTGGQQTPKAKVALVLVVTLVVLATLVLCCMAIGQVARLIEVDPTRL
jgi:hypothetical protein